MNNYSEIGCFLANYDAEQVFIVRDASLPAHRTLGLEHYPTLLIEASEASKSLASVERIWDFLLAHNATRKALLINIGGGVVCDLGGFAASTYKRGIDYIHIPTTLLSMVDAAWGGKTGFNYGGYKNLIGVIRPPQATLLDPLWLTTLPEREKLSGYAEILKCALLKSSEAFYGSVAALEDGDYVRYLDMAIEVKQSVVAQDPAEEGLRKVLNLGHTVGHAIEAVAIQQGRAVVPHGYAVLYGLVVMAYISHVRLGLDKKVVQTLSHAMVEHYGRMPFACKDYRELIRLMYGDKKNERDGEISMVLLRHIGEPVINHVVREEELTEALDYLFSL